jgi:hypothetical protein
MIEKDGSVRTTRNAPSSIHGGEIPIKVSVDIPNELFIKPTLIANISINHVPRVEITSEVISNIEGALKEKGIDVKLTIQTNTE